MQRKQQLTSVDCSFYSGGIRDTHWNAITKPRLWMGSAHIVSKLLLSNTRHYSGTQLLSADLSASSWYRRPESEEEVAYGTMSRAWVLRKHSSGTTFEEINKDKFTGFLSSLLSHLFVGAVCSGDNDMHLREHLIATNPPFQHKTTLQQYRNICTFPMPKATSSDFIPSWRITDRKIIHAL